MIRNIFKEPLLQFAVGALIVFAYFAVSGAPSDDDTIVIDETRLSAQWRRAWRRAPTQIELQGLVNEAVRDEVLYREALRLGLDRDDAVVRNRLLQKMSFMFDQSVAAPTEAQLQALLENNQNKYALPSTASLEQVFLGQTVNAQNLQKQLESLTNTGLPITDTPKLSTIQRSFNNTPLPTLDKLFGRDFTRQLSDLKQGEWQVPVRSGYGDHAVLLKDISAPQSPSLAMPLVRKKVENDWLAQETAANQASQLAELSKQYQIEVISQP